MKEQIGFDKSSKKFICPGCGKKRFVKYYNFTLNEYFQADYGRCDREISCGYNKPLTEYFKTNNLEYKWKPVEKSYIPPSKLDLKLIVDYGKNYSDNNFVYFLNLLFNVNSVQKIISDYYIGTSCHWRGATIFWQVDNLKKIRSGKIILYDKISGKRVKKPFNHINWFHKTNKIENFNLSQCLFGLHLINKFPKKGICIVESEKTACIMSVIAPESIWIATGSLSNINTKLFAPLIEKNITFYPDTSLPSSKNINCYEKWNEKKDTLIKKGFNVSISNLLEEKATIKEKSLGFDLADYFVPQLLNKKLSFQIEEQNKIKSKPIELISKTEKLLNRLKEVNPKIDILINELDLRIKN